MMRVYRVMGNILLGVGLLPRTLIFDLCVVKSQSYKALVYIDK